MIAKGLKLQRLFQKGGMFQGLGLSKVTRGVYALFLPVDRQNLKSWQEAWWRQPSLESAHTLLLQVGYPRSGHTLISALLSAHPQAKMGEESFIWSIFQRRGKHVPTWHYLYLLISESLAYTGEGRSSTGELYKTVGEIFAPSLGGYAYKVEGFNQLEKERLEVVGSKASRNLPRMLAKTPDLLDRFVLYTGLRLRMLHIVRNPFDMLATRAVQIKITNSYGAGNVEESKRMHEQRSAAVKSGGKIDDILQPGDFETALDATEDNAKFCSGCMERYGSGVMTEHHEDFIADPEKHLVEVLEHVGLQPVPGYLEACSKIVNPVPRITRHTLTWTDEMQEQVRTRLIERFPWFSHYRLED